MKEVEWDRFNWVDELLEVINDEDDESIKVKVVGMIDRMLDEYDMMVEVDSYGVFRRCVKLERVLKDMNRG